VSEKGGNRRWFIHAAAGSALVGLGMRGWSTADPWVQKSEAIRGPNVVGTNSEPYPNQEEADIWVFSGQSNSQGYGMLKAPVEPDPRILFFNANNRWVVAKEPLNPFFTNWDPDPVRENILLQRTGVDYPSGADTEKLHQANEASTQRSYGWKWTRFGLCQATWCDMWTGH
jgi:hypothetical protein